MLISASWSVGVGRGHRLPDRQYRGPRGSAAISIRSPLTKVGARHPRTAGVKAALADLLRRRRRVRLNQRMA
jgi:hypothetical protein